MGGEGGWVYADATKEIRRAKTVTIGRVQEMFGRTGKEAPEVPTPNLGQRDGLELVTQSPPLFETPEQQAAREQKLREALLARGKSFIDEMTGDKQVQPIRINNLSNSENDSSGNDNSSGQSERAASALEDLRKDISKVQGENKSLKEELAEMKEMIKALMTAKTKMKQSDEESQEAEDELEDLADDLEEAKEEAEEKLDLDSDETHDEDDDDGDDQYDSDEDNDDYEIPAEIQDQLEELGFDETECKKLKKVFHALEEENDELNEKFLEPKIIKKLTAEDFEALLRIDFDKDEEEGEGSLECEVEKIWRKVKLEDTDIKGIYERINYDGTHDAIALWKPEEWGPFKFEDFIKTIRKLQKENSVLLKQDSYWGNLTVKKIKLLMHSATKDKSSDEGDGLMRQERIAYKMSSREDTVNKWKDRGDSLESEMNEELYNKLNENLSVKEGEATEFFGKATDTEDPINNILKVAKAINTFKAKDLNPFKMSGNPLSDFENAIKDAVGRHGNSIKSLRETYIKRLKEINDNPESYENKKSHDAWIKAVGKNEGDEIEEGDIDKLLINPKYNYLAAVESIVEKLLNNIWSKIYSMKTLKGVGGKKTQEVVEDKDKLDSKDRAIIKYFSDFLVESNKEIKPFIEHRIDEEETYRFDKMSRKKESEDKEHSSKSNKDKKKVKTATSYNKEWLDLRSEGCTLIKILVKSYCYDPNDSKAKNKYKLTSKEKPNLAEFKKIRQELIDKFIKVGEDKFSKKLGTVPKSKVEEYNSNLKRLKNLLETTRSKMKSRLKINDSTIKEELEKVKRYDKNAKNKQWQKYQNQGIYDFDGKKKKVNS